MRPITRSEDHVGEWKLTLWADTPEEIFMEAARVLSRESGLARGAPGPWERLSLTARDMPTLLVDWLNELIGRSEVAGRAYDEFRSLSLSGGHIEAEARGRPVVEWRSALKAATYHGLVLQRQGNRWKAVVLFDV
ncbi:MAG TPA: archease [Chthonomonadaceae bacterium]|nr:archease [Chthonomonadaceae bacterium]